MVIGRRLLAAAAAAAAGFGCASSPRCRPPDRLMRGVFFDFRPRFAARRGARGLKSSRVYNGVHPPVLILFHDLRAT